MTAPISEEQFSEIFEDTLITKLYEALYSLSRKN